MKRFTMVLVVSAMVLSLSACCSIAPEKGAITRLEGQHEKLRAKYLKYVDADPTIGGPNATPEQRAKAREDERLLFQSLKDITDSLKRSLGD